MMDGVTWGYASITLNYEMEFNKSLSFNLSKKYYNVNDEYPMNINPRFLRTNVLNSRKNVLNSRTLFST